MLGNDTVLKIEIQIDPKTGIRNVRRLDREFKRTGKSGSRAFKNVNTSVAGLNRTMAPTSRMVAGLGAAFGTWQMARLGRDIAMTGAAFKQQMATVGGITRATAGEFDRLEQIARDMGETTEWSAGQASQGLQFLAMAGFDVRSQIAALPDVLDLATAGQIDLGRASDIASNALTAMRLPVEELNRVNDTFIATITSSNTNMEMMAESFKYAAPVAAGYGMQITTLSALIGMLGNAGIQGSMAGTQLAASFSDVNKVFDKYGVSTERADGSTKDLVDAIELLEQRGASAGEIMAIFGERSGKAILALLGQGTEAIRAYITEIENAEGATKKLADQMRDTFSNELKALNSALESVKIDIFEEYEDDLRAVLQDSTRWIRDHKGEIVGFVGAVGRAAKEVTPLGVELLRFFAGVTTATILLRTETLLLNTAMKANIAAMAGYVAYKATRWMVDKQSGMDTIEAETEALRVFHGQQKKVLATELERRGLDMSYFDQPKMKTDRSVSRVEEDKNRSARQVHDDRMQMVEELRAKMQEGAREEINTALKVAAADKDILSARLGEYNKFHAALERQVADHARKEARQIKSLNNLYMQQRDIRRTTEEMLAGLRGQDADPLDQYQDQKQRLDHQFLEAMQMSGQEQVDALEGYKQAVNSMAREFQAGVEGISGSDIAAQAIRDIEQAYQAQQWAMESLTQAAERQTEADRIWSQELQASVRDSAGEISSLEGTISLLDARMQAMDKQLELEGVDLVSPAIDQIQRNLAELRDKTITITTNHIDNYVSRFSGGGSSVTVATPKNSYAVGTDYVPETGLYELHRGEAVLTVEENRKRQDDQVVSRNIRDETLALPDVRTQAMDKQLELEGVDLVSPVVDGINSQLNGLHDKTITITTNHIDRYISDSSGPSVSAPVRNQHHQGDYVPTAGLYTPAPDSEMAGTGLGSVDGSAGRSKGWEGDLHVHLTVDESARMEDLEDPQWWKDKTRNYIKPELEGL